MPSAPPENEEYDPLFVNARREARWILVAFLACLVWTVGYSALFGYEIDASQLTLVLGMPSWVFWGVFIPWMSATVFSVWFGLVYMKEDSVESKAVQEGGE
ncbi:MAG: YhdT family protein [Rhodothermaceae bacterium]|nr:YhdT family protein [Rhodothermaceae bacterium]